MPMLATAALTSTPTYRTRVIKPALCTKSINDYLSAKSSQSLHNSKDGRIGRSNGTLVNVGERIDLGLGGVDVNRHFVKTNLPNSDTTSNMNVIAVDVIVPDLVVVSLNICSSSVHIAINLPQKLTTSSLNNDVTYIGNNSSNGPNGSHDRGNYLGNRPSWSEGGGSQSGSGERQESESTHYFRWKDCGCLKRVESEGA